MERAKKAEDSLFAVGCGGNLTILQKLKEAGNYLEFNELAKAGDCTTAYLSNRLRLFGDYGLVKKNVIEGKGIYYKTEPKGRVILKQCLRLHDTLTGTTEKPKLGGISDDYLNVVRERSQSLFRRADRKIKNIEKALRESS